MKKYIKIIAALMLILLAIIGFVPSGHGDGQIYIDAQVIVVDQMNSPIESAKVFFAYGTRSIKLEAISSSEGIAKFDIRASLSENFGYFYSKHTATINIQKFTVEKDGFAISQLTLAEKQFTWHEYFGIEIGIPVINLKCNLEKD